MQLIPSNPLGGVIICQFAPDRGVLHITGSSARPSGLLLVLVGTGVAIAGVVFAVRGMKKSFHKQLVLPSSSEARTAVTALGVTGFVAKGVVLLLAGLLIVVATLRAHPEQSTGLDGALKALRDQPFGIYVLAGVGAGLICYGLYMMFRARLARM